MAPPRVAGFRGIEAPVGAAPAVGLGSTAAGDHDNSSAPEAHGG